MKRVKYQKGNALCEVAFVFSCPGSEEDQCKHVCQGQTGANLSILIEYLHSKRSDIFQFEKKEDYMITNASDRVHYKAFDGKTEADDDEILDHNNLNRLKKELCEKKYILCMGEAAKKAVTAAGITDVIESEHLSFLNLNRKYKNASLNPSDSSADRNQQRIINIAIKILHDLQLKQRMMEEMRIPPN